MQENREYFRAISGYSNYEISNHGRARNATTGRILKNQLNICGYQYVNLCEDKVVKKHMIHRLVAEAFIENADNKPCVDHIDGNRQNNMVNNLRWATNQENQRNMKKRINTTSVFKGTSYVKSVDKWRAYICIEGKQTNLGSYDNEEDAARAYNEKAKEVFGEYSKLNDIPEEP